MRPDDAIATILRSLQEAMAEIPKSVEALREREVRGESANGAVVVFYSPLGELKRVEVEPDFLHSAGRQRVREALLEAFGRAERAADAARADVQGGLTFMGVPIGQALQGGSIARLLPPSSRISEVIDRQ